MHEIINMFKTLVEVPKGKSPLGRPRRRWQDTIKINLKVAHGGVVYIHVAQAREQWQARHYQLLKLDCIQLF
jgi:hypothetical protein